jgi:CHASE3 domain sensor protein
MISIQRIRKAVFKLGIILPAAAVVATIWMTHETAGQFNAAFTSVTRTYKVLNILEETQARAGDAETGQRGWLMTGREDYLTLHGSAMAALNNDIQQLRLLLSGRPTQQDSLDKLQNLIDERLTLGPTTPPSGLTNSSTLTAVELTDHGRDTMGQIRTLLFQMRQQETYLLKVQQLDAEAKFLLDQTILFVLVGIAAIALIVIISVLLRLEHLRQMVTVCAWTGRVNYEGEWIRLEDYLNKRFGISVSHGISKEAAAKMIQEMRQTKAPSSPPESPAG